MSDNFVDFRIVKERVSIEAVLGHYNIRLRQVNRNSLRGKCPLPTHSSKESKESFCVNTDKNIWSCMSESCSAARQGKRGGNIIDLVAVIERSSIRDAALKLSDWFLSSSTSATHAAVGKGSAPKTETEKLVAEKKRELPTAPDVVNKPLTFALKDIDHTHSYVHSRGLTEETAKLFGVGFFPGKGMMAGRCVIPIHNEVGELVAYAGRAIDATEPKYKLPNGFKKSDVLFNFHRAKMSGASDPLIVVEGFFDCMNVVQAGFARVVALMGSSMSDAQQKLLSDFPRVMLFLDGDAAGREGALAIATRLMYTAFVKVVALPDGKQPDQLSSDEIKTWLSI